MKNPEFSASEPVESISSLAVNNNGDVVIVTEGTDGSYLLQPNFDIMRAQEIFLTQQKVNSFFDEVQSRGDETQSPDYIPVNLDEIQRQIELAREAGKADS